MHTLLVDVSSRESYRPRMTWIYALTNLRTGSQNCTSKQTQQVFYLESRNESDVCAARQNILSKPFGCVTAQTAGGLNNGCEG